MKKKHTPMDLMILAAVLLLILGAFFKAHTLERTRQESVAFTYTMEIQAPSPDLTDALKEGDEVFDTQGKAAIGQIRSLASTENGIVLTLSAEGTPMEGGYRVGVYDVVPGYFSAFFTADAAWEGTVRAIE